MSDGTRNLGSMAPVPPPPPLTKRKQSSSRRREVLSLIDGDVVHATLDDDPTEESFKFYFDQLDASLSDLVASCLRHRHVDAALKDSGMSKAKFAKSVELPLVMNAIYQGLLFKLETKKAREATVQNILSETSQRRRMTEDVTTMLMTDRDHLQAMASELSVNGDGKRAILREVIAYGMQVRKLTDAEVDVNGRIVIPAVFELADPKIAISATQELNRMDHEYGQDDKATSSLESQADRVQRLREEMQKVADKSAAAVDGVAKKIVEAEIQEKQDE